MSIVVAMLIATNAYPFQQIAELTGRDLATWLPTLLPSLPALGIHAWEPSIAHLADAHRQVALVQAAGLAMPSVYCDDTRLHDGEVDAVIDRVVAIAQAVRPSGCGLIVLNPEPTDWTTPRAKTDAELARQAAALDRIGARLVAAGMRLAVHWHAPEWLAGGIEAQDMLLSTDPALVQLCFDVHWTWRAAGGRQRAIDHVLRCHASRIAVLHLRQSRAGVWSETVEDGDVDYAPVARALAAQRPLLVLERAIEAGTPMTLDPLDAHRRSAAWVRACFAAWNTTRTEIAHA